MKTLPLLVILLGSLCSCAEKKSSFMATETYPFTFKGLLQKPEVTSYMYGSHSISGNGKMYALQSTAVNLDSLLNKTVTIKGVMVNGYPLNGGPELIDVKAVE